ncbi:MAG: hypothetical protein KGR26_16135, partial [Cyanobacteria bacterium REEB65]|nr:hypothetical protein [Cyanobacteria bacterium REEB65]
DGKVDPDKFWHDKSVPQKIATVVGAALLNAAGALTGGGADLGIRTVNGMIDRSIALQQANLDRKRVAAGHIENLYGLFLSQSKSEMEAFEKTKAVLYDAAIADVAKAGVAAKGQVQAAEMDKFIAGLRLQRDEILMKLHAAASKGASSGPGGFIPIEQGSHVVMGPDGQQYLIGMGGEQVAGAIATSERAAQRAEHLAQITAPGAMPDPSDWTRYQQWIGDLRETLKDVAVLGSAHLGSGGQGNIARMKAYAAAIAGPDNDPAGVVGGVLKYPEFASGLAAQIHQNAIGMAENVRKDNVALLQANNALPGTVAAVQAHGTGEFKGMGVTKQVFVPGARRQQAPQAPVQKNPFQSFQAGQ